MGIVRPLLTALSAAVLAAGLLLAAPVSAAPRAPATVAAGAPATPGPVICGQPILNSPFSYTGAATTFTSGQYAGLPTFGAAGTNFPDATSGVIIPPGNHTANAGSYQTAHTIYYFEPGTHNFLSGMYSGNHTVYVGGYTAGAGKAIIDGVDGATNGGTTGGTRLESASTSSASNVYDTWEYLTIQNYSSSSNSSVMGNINGDGFADGNTYKYDTIGPNLYGAAGSYPPTSGQDSGGGYAIDGANNTTIEYSCLTHNAQGGFNLSNAINLTVANNEISWNGIGTYPDTGASPGQSTHGCGCSGGGKAFYALNANFVNNYVHDNYNVGLWLDFNNVGFDISHNYVANNWSAGIMLEASYNTTISDNTLVGNGWASDGAWPAGVGGGACYGGASCTNGNGPVTGAGGGNPFGAIDLSNSGGNDGIGAVAIPSGTTVAGCASSCSEASRYAGKMIVSGNVLTDNFGALKLYTDAERYPGNIDNDSACSMPMGVLWQPNSATYYQQSRVLKTNSADASVSGSAVTSTGGTHTICADYGTTCTVACTDGNANASQTPAAGMGVYNMAGGFLGNVASASSATSFTLDRSPGNVSGVSLILSAYGGCGPADYYGGSPGVSTGTPSATYWDHCIWGSLNLKVSNNQFNMNATTVTGCTTGANLCGYQYLGSFNPGIPVGVSYWSNGSGNMQSTITHASGAGNLGNVLSNNAYVWTGGGAGGWIFTQGSVGNSYGNTMTKTAWQASPNFQDAGSTISP